MSTFLSRTNQSLFLLFVLILGICFSLVGCGGGTVTPATPPNAKVVINWPAQTREFEAPSYAGSARISLLAGGSIAPIEWVVDRPSTAAQTITYPSPSTLPAGPATISMVFYSDPAAAGKTVASLDLSVRVSPDGTLLLSDGSPLASISSNTKIKNLVISVGVIAVGETKPITVYGQIGQEVVALPQDAVSLTVTNGSQFGSIANKNLTANAQGTVEVTANIDEITTARGIEILAAYPTHTRNAFVARHLGTSANSNVIWGTFGDTSAYPNSIVDIDGATGTVGTPIPVGTNPNTIGISADGTIAYVGVDGRQVKVVDLVNRVVTSTIDFSSISTSDFPIRLQVNPTNANEFAMILKADDNNARKGPYIYRNGTLLPRTHGLSLSTGTWISGNEYVMISNPFTKLLVTNSVDKGVQWTSNILLQGEVHYAGNSKMIFDDGRVFSTIDLKAAGFLNFTGEGIRLIATDYTSNLAWAAIGSRIRVYELSNYTSKLVTNLPIGTESIVEFRRFGATGLTMLTNQALYIVPVAPGI